MKKKAVVAMSGGVDSSLTAALLQEEGYEVIGVTMRLADESQEQPADERGCCSLSAVDDARRVAEILGIPHYVMDFRAMFREKVIAYFLREYARGRTPNPCIACNRHIKFEGLLQRARELGADYLATGHYARIERDGEGRFLLKKGVDEKKDQSYVLYHLTQAALGAFLLPLGGYTKERTRQLAEELRLPVAHKPDSQEICFVPGNDYRAYLRAHLPECCRSGDIVDRQGHVLGRHEGVAFYTIGQRRNLGIAAGTPLYVAALDAAGNRVVVGGHDEVFSRGLLVEDISWTLPALEVAPPPRAMVRIRYGKKEAAAELMPQADGCLRVAFDEPQRAPAPGQSAVFYDGDVLLGGGIIAATA